MNWLSIDPSNRTGLAFWKDGTLLFTGTARAKGTKGRWIVEHGNGVKEYASKWELFVKAFDQQDALVMEEGFGQFSTAIKSQAEYRGFFKAVASYIAFKGHTIAVHVVNVQEWRRAIKDEFALSWPATTERKKALSVATVQKAYGIRVNDDEADAVLLGRAVVRLGIVTIGGSNG
jgi:hypothetical protein